MRSSKHQTKSISTIICGLLITLFLIASGSQLKAGTYLLQDSTKKMSHMDHKSMTGMKSDMQKMHKNMMGVKMTGNPDYDFASMMIKHHQGAIDMSKKEVSKGKDQEVKSIARKIIDDQSREVKNLQAFVKKNRPSKTSATKEETGSSGKDMMDEMKDMDKKMQDMEMKGDQDHDYVSMMIMHHQGAIDMAKNYLDKAKDENLKKMAQKMIDENKDQIDKLKDWQDKHD